MMSHSVIIKICPICSDLKLHPAFRFRPQFSLSLLCRVAHSFKPRVPHLSTTTSRHSHAHLFSFPPSNSSDSLLPTTSSWSPLPHSVLLRLPSFVGDLRPDCSDRCHSLPRRSSSSITLLYTAAQFTLHLSITPWPKGHCLPQYSGRKYLKLGAAIWGNIPPTKKATPLFAN